MIQEQIQEGNTLIAFFMGAKEMSSTTTPDKIKTINSFTAYHNGAEFYCRNYEAKTTLKYHLSWDWLMPVVEKIEQEQGCIIEMWLSLGKGCKINRLGSPPEPTVIPFVSESNKLIDAVYQSVIEFIKWYNQQSK